MVNNSLALITSEFASLPINNSVVCENKRVARSEQKKSRDIFFIIGKLKSKVIDNFRFPFYRIGLQTETPTGRINVEKSRSSLYPPTQVLFEV